MKEREPWWTWRWDTVDVPGELIEANALVGEVKQLTRWRRGSFLTVYRIRTREGAFWLFYGPFNFSCGFGFPW